MVKFTYLVNDYCFLKRDLIKTNKNNMIPFFKKIKNYLKKSQGNDF